MTHDLEDELLALQIRRIVDPDIVGLIHEIRDLLRAETGDVNRHRQEGGGGERICLGDRTVHTGVTASPILTGSSQNVPEIYPGSQKFSIGGKTVSHRRPMIPLAQFPEIPNG